MFEPVFVKLVHQSGSTAVAAILSEFSRCLSEILDETLLCSHTFCQQEVYSRPGSSLEEEKVKLTLMIKEQM